jgi:hypothetical protein
MNPCNTVFGVERIIGRNFNDQDVQSDMKVLRVLLFLFRSGRTFLQTRPGRSTSFIADLSILHIVNAPTAAYRIDRQAPGELNTLTVSLIWVVVL